MKTILTKISQLFESSKKKKERELRDLLRENLGLVAVDIFYLDDPSIGVPPDKRVEYNKKFFDICADKDVMERFKYLINKQARLTIQNSKDGTIDPLGGVNINGIASVKEDFEKFASAYLKSTAPVENFNRFNII